MNLQEEKLWGVELETKVAEDYANFTITEKAQLAL